MNDQLLTKRGILAGTLLGALWHVELVDVIATIVLATIGAIASYGVTLVLRKLTRKQ